MGEVKHTPGPWAYCDDGEIYHADEDGVLPRIATIDMDNVSPEQAEADCRLIAAAPDMLAALKVVAGSGNFRCFEDAEWDIVNSAIAAAEGR